MDRRQISALLVLDALDIDVDLSTFDKRLMVQKTIYLVQAADLDLGYFYSWYLKGPYCSDVAKDLFPAIAEWKSNKDTFVQWKLDEKTSSALDKKCRGLMSDEAEDLSKPRWLELIASVHYLVSRSQVEYSATKIESKLKNFDKEYSSTQVQRAIDQLVEKRLLSTA